MDKYVIDTVNEDNLTAIGKARQDIEDILFSLDYNKRNILIKSSSNYLELFRNIKSVYTQLEDIISEIPNGSEIIIQYPWDSMSYKYAKYLRKYKKKKNLNFTVIIHDLNSLRSTKVLGRLYFKYYVDEIKVLDSFDYIICHNKKMKYYLEKDIDSEKIIPLGIFDYLLDYKNESNNSDYKKVIIAGNLDKNKSSYLYKLDELKNDNYYFTLFGINYTGLKNNFLQYQGAIDSNELPKRLNTGFGLVWDGSSLESCEGEFGVYLKWNNPHKFSLYMASGIPVFIWKKSALASFVIKNNLGFAINSLNEIENILKNLTTEEYGILLKNVSNIQDKVINGEFLKNALDNR